MKFKGCSRGYKVFNLPKTKMRPIVINNEFYKLENCYKEGYVKLKKKKG